MADPLGYDVALPFAGRVYPIGYPLIVETNREGILETARLLWSAFPAREDGDGYAARLRLIVRDAETRMPPHPAPPRGQGHLVSIVHGPENFAVCDLASSFAFAHLTRDVAADTEYVRYHFLEPLAYLMIEAAKLTPLHASCVAWNGEAVVLCGDSGDGKTSLAYACAKHGWSFLSDDATYVLRERDQSWVAGRPFRIRFRNSARKLFPELEAFPALRRPNGKLDIEADTRLLGLQISTECRAGHIVFLNREESLGRASLEPYPELDARKRLETAICYGDEPIRAAQRESLTRLLKLPILQLRYADLDSAESSLRELVTSAALAA